MKSKTITIHPQFGHRNCLIHYCMSDLLEIALTKNENFPVRLDALSLYIRRLKINSVYINQFKSTIEYFEDVYQQLLNIYKQQQCYQTKLF